MTPTSRIARFSYEIQIARLRRKRRSLNARIQSERKRPMPCSLTLQRLKRQRVWLKDDLARIMARAGLGAAPGTARPGSA